MVSLITGVGRSPMTRYQNWRPKVFLNVSTAYQNATPSA